MPVLPLLYRRLQAAAEDTRIIDAREWTHGIETVKNGAQELVKRIPNIIPPSSHHDTDTAPLTRRQDAYHCDQGYIAACYQGLNAGPNPGAVVGIVLGAVFGFLLLLWVLFTLSSGGSFIRTDNLREGSDVVVTNTHHRHNNRSRSPRRTSHRSNYREEMRETTAAPPRRDRVVRQERISREIPRDVSRSRVRETVIVDEGPRVERRVDGDDVIEVIAEESEMGSAAPPPRRKSGRRSSGYRSVSHTQQQSESPSLSPDARIESGYRRVDPGRFAGGGFRQHRV